MNFDTTWICSAASRLYARKPEVVSGTSVPDARRTTALPSRWSRFFYCYLFGDEGKGDVQSRILGAVLFNAAMLLAALGVIGDLLSGQRIMLQRTFERVRRIELELGVPPSHYEPGAQPTGHEATTGAHAGRRGNTEEREALKV